MRAVLLFVAPALVSLAAASCIHEKLDGLPRGWKFHRDALHDEPLLLRVALQNQNVDEFEQRVYDISTPGHKLYGQHLEGHEVKSFLRPLETAQTAVKEWLDTYNISQIATDGEWVSLRTTVGEANAMLKTKFAWFHNKERKETKLRTLEYSIPEHLAEHVDFFHPTIKFPSTQELSSTIHVQGRPKSGSASNAWKEALAKSPAVGAPPDAICNTLITPQCLLNLYNVHYGADGSNGNTAGFASFLNQSARNTDLTLFETVVAPYARGQNFSVVTFNGGTNDQTSLNDATEANLDNQYLVSVGYPTPITEFITPGCGPLIPDPNEPAGACDNEPYLAFLKGILALPNSKLPQTLSVSYGEDEQTWPKKLAKKVCRQIAQLGARGVTVLFASGDFGPGSICENNAGTKAMFTPAFPASCPFITVVGATQNVGPEQAASFSGGGFSNYFAQPKYQHSKVSTYLKNLGSTQAAYFNPAGRGYPDVAAQGVDFLVVSGGVAQPVSGTSAASPAFAAIVALLNSARISSGKKPLGFLNPFLYSKGYKALTDIVNGGSTGCSKGTMTIPNAGWNATAGWDPATGLGTPDFGKLLAMVAPGVQNTGGVL